MDIIKARQELIFGRTIYDMNLKVADYGRVSTDKDDQINSLENQVNYFNDMIDNVKSWTHVASYSDEGISGTQVYKREEFLRMIEDAKLGKIDLILTKEIFNFGSNINESIKYIRMLLQYGVIVFFISDNINTIYLDNEFKLQVMVTMARAYNDKKTKKVKFSVKRNFRDSQLNEKLKK